VAADGDGLPAGSFVTRFDQDGVLITCIARFRREARGSWLGPADLAGWDVSASDRLPAPVLFIEVSATTGGVHSNGRLAREAGVDPVPSPQPTASVGP
jgi:hypothetical protein